MKTISSLLPDVGVQGYDGTYHGPAGASTVIRINHPRALIRILRAPRGLGLARAWVTGELDVEGNLHALTRHESALYAPDFVAALLFAGTRQLLRSPTEFINAGPPGIEYRRRWPGRHTVTRDLEEVEFHYGTSNRFYEALLGPSMTYSCAIFSESAANLQSAQANKHEIILDKLAVEPSSVLLDIGCGWGGLIRHAAESRGIRSIGLTASATQHSDVAGWARPPGVVVRYGDYRQLLPLPATAVASVGMYEHVGRDESLPFFRLVRHCLPAGGRYLNQAIVRREKHPSRFRRNGFVQRYIFPNAQLQPLSLQLRHLDEAGFRVLSVETFASHYVRTLRCWVSNLESNWSDCVAAVGSDRARAWRMYLEGAAARFEDEDIDVAQVLTEARK